MLKGLLNPFLFAKIDTLIWVRSSVVERVPDKNEAGGSIPPAPTIKNNNPYGDCCFCAERANCLAHVRDRKAELYYS